jgi:hypothetical protein
MKLECLATHTRYEVRLSAIRGCALVTDACLELINLVRHMKAYPNDSLGDALRNVFDFDIYKPETIDNLSQILLHHGYVRSYSPES